MLSNFYVFPTFKCNASVNNNLICNHVRYADEISLKVK